MVSSTQSLPQPAAVAPVDAATPGAPAQSANSIAPHNSDSGHPAGAPRPETALPLSRELRSVPASGPVQMAQMVNRAAQSEMRIGMTTSAFGNVEVRTVVHANEVGVLIGSEKGDLRVLLANELPGIANTLQQQDLRLNQVNFHQGFALLQPNARRRLAAAIVYPRIEHSRTQSRRKRPVPYPDEPVGTSRAHLGGGLSILA